MKSNILIITGAALSGLLITVSPLFGQGTAFTYQGHLKNGTNSTDGTYDFRFLLSPDGTTNRFVGSPSTNNAVAVNDGLFTAAIDFGTGIFTGSNYWLAVEVRTNGVGPYTRLLPLQPLTPTPYAIFAITASNLSGALSAAQLSGSIPSANISGSYNSALVFNHPSNSFTGSFNGNGAGLTALNASSLTTGTVADARLSANVALLPANQTFSGANALTNSGNLISGNGAGLSMLNASSLSSGTVPDTRLSANVPQLNGNQTFSGTNAFVNAGNSFAGSGTDLSALNASSLSTGTVADARLSPNVALLSANQTFSGANALTNSGNLLSGNGAGLNTLNASSLSSGTVSDSRLSTNVARLNGNQMFSGTNTFNNGGNTFAGNGTGLTGLNASSLSTGTLADARLSTNVPLLRANQTFTGANALTNVGNTLSGNGAGLSSLNASSLFSGTLADARLSTNVPLLRANQTFSGANALTNVANRFGGDGAGLTSLNASNLANGTVSDVRLSSNVPLLSRQTNTFNGTVVAGDMRLANSTQSVVSALDVIRIVRGNVLANGTRANGTGFTVDHTNGSGIYRLRFTTPFNDTPTILATITSAYGGYLQLVTSNIGATNADIFISTGTFSMPQDSGFGFAAIGAR